MGNIYESRKGVLDFYGLNPFEFYAIFLLICELCCHFGFDTVKITI